jgi:hypothetical protein
MTLAKLNKYLNKYSAAVIPAQFQKLRVPVVLSDSKGLYLKSSVSQSGTKYPMVVRVEQENK